MKKLSHLLLFSIAILSATIIYAQGTPDDPDAQVPIDGGIFTVVGAAAAYGAYKLRKEKGEKSDENIN